MEYSNPDLVEAFFEREKHKYPHLTKAQIKEVVVAPWYYAREQMGGDELPQIRMKYFGTFKVYPSKAKTELTKLENYNKLGYLREGQYSKVKSMILKFLKANDESKSNPQ